ncbi:MAG: c-type cytochrome [Gammaproteobacteria bacterium]|nr:c-type cytochrome [Gammaproteobacteria bacterium]MBU1440115.1 c-type cytochrome [Gammaproteobacteria bacterium]MBU2287878.1 c-type cytochrome [Gammaproteobacteria bacterium]MBU2410126.1 c-type cytochrome [Gammaproteobacteria bacterium]
MPAPSPRHCFGLRLQVGRRALAATLTIGLAACDSGPLPLPHAGAPESRQLLGQRLLAQYQCGSCHAIPGVEAARANVGPPLEAFGRRSYIAGHVPNAPDTLARWIVEPHALVPDSPMPSMGVAPDDARAMAAYLLSLR